MFSSNELGGYSYSPWHLVAHDHDDIDFEGTISFDRYSPFRFNGSERATEQWTNIIVASHEARCFQGGCQRCVVVDADVFITYNRQLACEAKEIADARERLFTLISQTPNLTWFLFTDNPQNVQDILPSGRWPNLCLGVTIYTNEDAWKVGALKEFRNQIPGLVVEVASFEDELNLDLKGIDGLKIGGTYPPDKDINFAGVADLLLAASCQDIPVWFTSYSGFLDEDFDGENLGSDPCKWPVAAVYNCRNFPFPRLMEAGPLPA